MTIPAYTIDASHPRLLFNASDKSTLQARVANASGWKSIWDNTVVPAANSYKGYTDVAIATNANVHCRIFVLTLAGYLLESGAPAGGYKAKAISAAVYLAGLADDVPPTNKRHRALALAIVFDVLYDDLTTGQKDTLAAEMIQQADRMQISPQEYMDGWSANDQMCQAACALAGYGYGSWNWSSRLTEALTFFYGANPEGGALTTPEYFGSDGGDLKGGWYLYLAYWASLWFLTMMEKATDLDAWAAETWTAKVWEWLLWVGDTGGASFDREAQGDSAYLTNPIFQIEHRWALSILAARHPTPNGTEGGKHLRWLYDRWATKDTAYADNLIFDIVFLDLAAFAGVAPEDAASPVASTRVFEPPGIGYHRAAARGSGDDPWDFDQTVVARFSARRHFDLGHRHLDSGSLFLAYKGDPLLLAPAGIYDAYSSTHHLSAYQRTWLQSLAPLIVDPSQVYQFWSDVQANDGGQHWKKVGAKSDPYRVFEMLTEGGGVGWIRSYLSAPSTGTGDVFWVADLRPAYQKVYTDPLRADPLKAKLLIIEPTAANGLTWPAFLYFLRVTKADQSQRVIVPLHSAKTWTSTAYGAHVLGSGEIGKLWVDVRDIGNYTLTIQGPGTPLDGLGYGPDQFKIPGGDGTNWKPSKAPNFREAPTLKTSSLYIEKTTRVQTEDVVLLLMPTAAGDSEPVPSRAWVTDAAQPDFYGITIGSSTYLISRTQDLVVVGSPDTTPPGEVSSLSVVGRDRRIAATWTDPGDADYAKARIYVRTSAIT